MRSTREMFENLTVLQLFALLKRSYPDRVHGLKGNHENVANEDGRGNHPFGKVCLRGGDRCGVYESLLPGAPV
jgi:hypothetical protein